MTSTLPTLAAEAGPSRHTLEAIFQSASCVDWLHFENSPQSVVAGELVPTVRIMLRDAAQAIDSLLSPHVIQHMRDDACEGAAPGERPDEGSAVLRRWTAAHREIADARNDLARVNERLTALATPDQEASRLIAECQRACKSLRLIACAVENTVAAATGDEPTLDMNGDLESSLRVRRAYGRFRRALGLDIPPSAPEIPARLAIAREQLTKLLDDALARDLRITDRLQLRSLAVSLNQYLEMGAPAPEHSVALWKDINRVARVLGDLNQRHELAAHDAWVLHEAFTSLYMDDDSGTAVPLEIRANLARLEGLDDEIDTLLYNDRGMLRRAWRHPLERLLRQRGLPPSNSPVAAAIAYPAAVSRS